MPSAPRGRSRAGSSPREQDIAAHLESICNLQLKRQADACVLQPTPAQGKGSSGAEQSQEAAQPAPFASQAQQEESLPEASGESGSRPDAFRHAGLPAMGGLQVSAACLVLGPACLTLLLCYFALTAQLPPLDAVRSCIQQTLGGGALPKRILHRLASGAGLPGAAPSADRPRPGAHFGHLPARARYTGCRRLSWHGGCGPGVCAALRVSDRAAFFRASLASARPGAPAGGFL